MKLIDPDNPPNELESNPPKRQAQILRFDGVTLRDLPAEQVIEGAAEKGLQSVVVLGYDADGDEYFASSIADGADVLWLMERLKQRLLGVPDGTDERHA
jgi:hypothetical protein